MPTASRAGDSTHEKAGRHPVPVDGTGGVAEAAPEGVAGDSVEGAGGTVRDPAESAESVAGSLTATVGWRAPAGLVILAVTAVGLVLRVLLFLRPGFLTSGTVEYDDGVYLGAAIRLLQGALPYKDFAYVQPPGIEVLALPFAVVAKVISAPAGLAAARVASALASAACVPLAGHLVRHKGVTATLVTCGFLAVYPADVLTARTLLLEPWMNLCCLLAANVAFSSGKLAGSRRRLAGAGVLLGFAVSVKLWAAVPAAVLLCCLLAPGPRNRPGRGSRNRRAGAYLAGIAVGFVPPAAAFAVAAPGAFLHQTVFDQVTRMGSYTSLASRLAYLTGLLPVMNRHGTLDFTPGAHSMFAVGSSGATVTGGVGWAPYAVAALGAVVLAAAYLRRPASRQALDWFALAVAALAVAAVSLYSAFFYHYPAFPAPWLAIAFGAVAGRVATGRPVAGRLVAGRVAARQVAAGRVVATCAALAILGAAAVEGSQLATQYAPSSPRAVADIVPSGACVISDQVSFLIAAKRFDSAPGCPDILDSLAETLTLSGGVSVPGGAGDNPRVTAGWETIFAKAGFVWLTDGYRARIPWTPALQSWFTARFRLVRTFPAYGNSRLYERR